MPLEKLANNAVSVLGSGMTATQVTVPLRSGDGALMPSTGPFRFKVAGEIMLIQSRTGDTLTTYPINGSSSLPKGRGLEGTARVSHVAGDDARLIITAAGARNAFGGIVLDAPGDGTNQTAQFLEAIREIPTSPGTKLLIPNGDYVVDPIVWPAIAGLTIEGEGFPYISGANSPPMGGVRIRPSTHGGQCFQFPSGSPMNQMGLTMKNLGFTDLDVGAKRHTINSATVDNTTKIATLTLAGGSADFAVGQAIWVIDCTDLWNGRWTVLDKPDSTKIRIQYPFNPEQVIGAGLGRLGQVTVAPSSILCEIQHQTKWKLERCSATYGLKGILFNSLSGDDLSWGHVEDCNGLFNDRWLTFEGGGNFSTWITGGNFQCGDDQAGIYQASSGSFKLQGYKMDTTTPGPAVTPLLPITGDRAVGVALEQPSWASIDQLSHEIEMDCIGILAGVGDGWSWARSVVTVGGKRYGENTIVPGNKGGGKISIDKVMLQHNDTKNGRGIVVMGTKDSSGGIHTMTADIDASHFGGAGLYKSVEIGLWCYGVTVNGGGTHFAAGAGRGDGGATGDTAGISREYPDPTLIGVHILRDPAAGHAGNPQGTNLAFFKRDNVADSDYVHILDDTKQDVSTTTIISCDPAGGESGSHTMFATRDGVHFAGPIELQNTGQQIYAGTVAPNGNVAAFPGSVYFRSNGEVHTKTSGTGTSGWTQLAGGAPSTVAIPIATFTQTGALAVGLGTFHVPIKGNWTISEVRATLDVPGSASSRIDVDRNGGSLWATTGAQPTFASGDQVVSKTTFATTSLVDGDQLTADVDTAAAAAANLTVVVFAVPA